MATITKIVDLSGNNAGVNYDQLKAQGYGGAIIKAGQLFTATKGKIAFKSSGWDVHFPEVKKRGFAVGAYVYAMAKTTEDVREEARETLNVIGKNTLELPIFYDMEDAFIKPNGAKLNTDLYLVFKEIITGAGYKCGLYANPDWLKNNLDFSRLSSEILWLAHWTESPENESKYAEQYTPDLWQWGLLEPDKSGFYAPGNSAKPTAKAIDGNVCYTDFSDNKAGAPPAGKNDTKYNFDVNGDGKVDQLDLIALQRNLAGWEDYQ